MALIHTQRAIGEHCTHNINLRWHIEPFVRFSRQTHVALFSNDSVKMHNFSKILGLPSWTPCIHSDHAYMYKYAYMPRIMHHGAFILPSLAPKYTHTTSKWWIDLRTACPSDCYGMRDCTNKKGYAISHGHSLNLKDNVLRLHKTNPIGGGENPNT